MAFEKIIQLKIVVTITLLALLLKNSPSKITPFLKLRLVTMN